MIIALWRGLPLTHRRVLADFQTACTHAGVSALAPPTRRDRAAGTVCVGDGNVLKLILATAIASCFRFALKVSPRIGRKNVGISRIFPSAVSCSADPRPIASHGLDLACANSSLYAGCFTPVLASPPAVRSTRFRFVSVTLIAFVATRILSKCCVVEAKHESFTHAKEFGDSMFTLPYPPFKTSQWRKLTHEITNFLRYSEECAKCLRLSTARR